MNSILAFLTHAVTEPSMLVFGLLLATVIGGQSLVTAWKLCGDAEAKPLKDHPETLP